MGGWRRGNWNDGRFLKDCAIVIVVFIKNKTLSCPLYAGIRQNKVRSGAHNQTPAVFILLSQDRGGDGSVLLLIEITIKGIATHGGAFFIRSFL